ncbi:hypothetical protein ACOSQ2_017271 [Xanthoceras sorbifolium]
MNKRGNKATIDGHERLKWPDSEETSSVVYACLGSPCNMITSQLIKLGLGLEASNRPFIWETDQRERPFGSRIGLGWARQVLISAEMPMATWPLFADQFVVRNLLCKY